MKHPPPNAAAASAAHWQAAGEGRLALPFCPRCQCFDWPPRARCSHCGGEPTWRDASGRGRIATFSIVRRAVNPMLQDAAPYAVGFVELDEGVRLFTNFVAVEPDRLRTGMRVRARFEVAIDPALHVPVFAPEDD